MIQPMAMENLLASVAPDQCFWYAHPREEERPYQRARKGELFTNDVIGNTSRLTQVTPDDAEKVTKIDTDS